MANEPTEAPLNRAMIIMAHPDDCDFICAGTAAKWAKEGKDIVLVVITDGSKGSSDESMTSERLIALREAEQRAAAHLLGFKDVWYLHYEDAMLEPTLALRRDLVRCIRQYRPDIVICQDPNRRWGGSGYLNHPDHRAAGEAALAAIYPTARDRLTFPDLVTEGLLPHKVREVYIGATNDADTFIDISETIDLKIAALKAHASQIDPTRIDERVREMSANTGKEHNLAHAEAFKLIRLS